MNILVDDLQVPKKVTDDLMKAFDELRTRAAELVALDDPSPDPKLIRKLQQEVNTQIDVDMLWVPE